MFHPLLPDISNLKDTDLENKINELTKKYFIAANSGNGGLCDQISVALEQYKAEFAQRGIEKTKKVTVSDQSKDLDNLINVNK